MPGLSLNHKIVYSARCSPVSFFLSRLPFSCSDRNGCGSAPQACLLDDDGQALLNQVIDFYHRQLLDAPEAQAWLVARGLNHPDLVSQFRLGYAGKHGVSGDSGLLPSSTCKDGKALRSRLAALTPNAITNLTSAYVKRSGIDKPGACHLFRHAMATQMLENGADVRWIQAMLGHASPETTQIYT